ncbi:CesT family type III secretion system chaperone [Pluralibacter sp.]|jgi:hypothetical protein|uniref:CesT family type III secretion system chaperone n=1 Tax=Pluralibacter sp. TaxID=1920032 RepID=UPI0025F22698|nr:CesT family type III secretion system chaperone [Pluralibacter sp.]MBV8045280.1 CesT family type III secretion system chaperone [Pluralibacter sp.]
METLLYSLYDALDLELDGEDATLLIGDDLLVHFDESSQGLEMICPLGELPSDTARLQYARQMNYFGPCGLAADAEGTTLLALARMPEGSSAAELLKALEDLIQAASAAKRELGLTR